MSILAVSGPWALLVGAACMLPSRIPSGKPFASFTVCWTCWGLKHLDSQYPRLCRARLLGLYATYAENEAKCRLAVRLSAVSRKLAMMQCTRDQHALA